MPIAQGLLKEFRIYCSPACPTAQGGHSPHNHLREQEGGWHTRAGALPAQDGYKGCRMEQQMGLSNAILGDSPKSPRCREGCDAPISRGACTPGLPHPPSPPGQGTAMVPGITWTELGLTVALQPFARQEGGQEWSYPSWAPGLPPLPPSSSHRCPLQPWAAPSPGCR